MIERALQSRLTYLATKFPFVLITGPRQSGKSTLAKMTFPDYRYISFADLDIRRYAEEDPRGFIANYPDKVIIDEVQKVPSILSYLQTYTDNENREGMYILTGSQNMLLMDSVDQTLAGRVAILKLLPFSLAEMRGTDFLKKSVDECIFYGCYPRLYDKNIAPQDYYPSYISTYVERDVRNITEVTNLSLFVKFIKLCAGRIGQLLNKASIATECGVSEPTVRAWLSILEQCYIIHFLYQDHKNFSKRVVKTPKMYFYDTGLVCSLLEISSYSQVSSHYLRGNLFENMIVNELVKGRYNRGLQSNLTFWRDSNGNEVDVIMTEAEKQSAYEIKSGATFNKDFLKGLNYWGALSGADREHKSVIYGGENSMLLSDAKVISWNGLI